MTGNKEPANDDSARESAPDIDSAEHLLRELEARMQAAPDPLAALAGMLGSRASRSATFTKQGTVIGDHRLDGVLGVGGMGVTYLGVSATGAHAAIKVVEAMAEPVRERFGRECQILQSLEHPAIVRYRGHGVLADGCAWLMMDLVPGTDLEALLDDLQTDAPRLPASATLLGEISSRGPVLLADPRYHRRVLRVLATVADAVDHVHARGIVHRDLKPANILVTDALDPVVIDFGLSRDAFQKVSLTRSGIALGTLAYMAPEQLDRDPGQVDRRADVFALGLVLYRALVGCDLRGETRDIVRHHRRPFVLAAAVARRLPLPIQAILYRCLDPRPGRRYPTTAALADDLRAAAGNETVKARRPGVVARHLRRPAGAVTRVGVSVGVLAVALWAAWPEVLYRLNVVVGTFGRCKIHVDGMPFEGRVESLWLSPGVHVVRLEPADGLPETRTIHLNRDPQTETVLVRPNLRPEAERSSHEAVRYPGADAALVQITSAGTLQRDRWFVDDDELPSRTIFVWLEPGAHTFAVEAFQRDTPVRRRLFREEIRLDLPAGSLTDLSLAPRTLADAPGAVRCTWATVLSPLPRGLSLEPGGATTFMEPSIQRSEFDLGWSSVCALTAPLPRRAIDAVLRYEPVLPEGHLLRSAAAWLRSEHSDLERVLVEFRCRTIGGSGEWIEWPHADAGRLVPRLELRVPQGFVAFEVRARWQQGQPPSSTATVRHLLGTFCGGHINTDPCCFAFAGDFALGPAPDVGAGWIAQSDGLAWRATDTLPGSPKPEFDEVNAFPELLIAGTPRGPRLGGSLALLGDLNGNGTPEIAVADVARQGLPNTRLWVLDARTGRTVHVHDGSDIANWHAAAVGDGNGDGVPDYVIGDPNESRWQANGGAVWVVCGRTGLVSQEYRLPLVGAGVDQDTQLGSAMWAAGDIDGNGIGDALIAAPGCMSHGHHSGRIVALACRVGASVPPVVLYDVVGRSADDQLTVVAAGRDLNDDGTPDFVSWRCGGAKRNRAYGRLKMHSGKTGEDLAFDVSLPTGGAVIAGFGGRADGGEFHLVALAVERIRDRSWSLHSGYGSGFVAALRASDGEWLWETEIDAGLRPLGSMVAIGDRNGDGWIDFAIGLAGNREPAARGEIMFLSGKDGAVLGRAIGAEGDQGFGEQMVFSSGDPDALLVGSHRTEEACGSVYRCKLPRWSR